MWPEREETLIMNYMCANVINFVVIKSVAGVKKVRFHDVLKVVLEARGSVSVPRVLQAHQSTFTRLRAPCGLK